MKQLKTKQDELLNITAVKIKKPLEQNVSSVTCTTENLKEASQIYAFHSFHLVHNLYHFILPMKMWFSKFVFQFIS